MLRRCFAVSVLVCLAVTAASAVTGTLQINLRDVITSQPVLAKITLQGPESVSVETNDAGSVTLTLPSGEYRIEVTTHGYKLARTHYSVAPGRKLVFTIMLDPTSPPPEESPEVITERIRPGFTLLHGYVVDAESDKALSGVKVSVANAGASAETDSKGHFFLSVPNPESTSPSGWRTDTLIYEKPGYRREVFENFGIYGEEMGGPPFGLEKGSGTNKHDATHKLMREDGAGAEEQQGPSSTLRLSPDLYKWLGASGTSFAVGSAANAATASTITVPSYVRVGSGQPANTTPKSYVPCLSKSNCTDVTAYPLESYITQGLPGEWPAWWDVNAQEAGSVAYRSYGRTWENLGELGDRRDVHRFLRIRTWGTSRLSPGLPPGLPPAIKFP